MIDMHGGIIHRRVPGNGLQNAICGLHCIVPSLGANCPGLQEPAMVKLYDPIGIALLGFGVLAVAALAFVY
jgi:hypothetical protein